MGSPPPGPKHTLIVVRSISTVGACSSSSSSSPPFLPFLPLPLPLLFVPLGLFGDFSTVPRFLPGLLGVVGVTTVPRLPPGLFTEARLGDLLPFLLGLLAGFLSLGSSTLTAPGRFLGGMVVGRWLRCN